MLATTYDNFWCSAGVHPDSESVREPTVDGLIELARRPKVVAIGETGSTTTASTAAAWPTWPGSANALRFTSELRSRPAGRW
jgi:hypothetical protein